MLVICSFREGEVQFKAFAKCRNTDFLRNLQTARKGRRSFVVVSKFSFSHPPTIPWVLTHTVGPITSYHRAWPETTTHTRGPQHARPRQAMPRPALHTGPHSARQWPGPPLAPARTRPGPLASTTHSHASTSTHRIRGSNTASPQVAPHALHSGPQIAPARHGPAPLTRITHGPNWGNPFVTHFIDHESWGQGVLLQMGGPPNTFTGATQPIPVRGDGSAQAGLPDANTGRDTRGVVNKHIQLCAVSLLTLCAYELDRVAGYRRWILNC